MKTKLMATCYACDRDVEKGVWIDGGDWTFYCLDCYQKYEKEFPSWEGARKRYWPNENEENG